MDERFSKVQKEKCNLKMSYRYNLIKLNLLELYWLMNQLVDMNHYSNHSIPINQIKIGTI